MKIEFNFDIELPHFSLEKAFDKAKEEALRKFDNETEVDGRTILYNDCDRFREYNSCYIFHFKARER
jgi:hypothetical protein